MNITLTMEIEENGHGQVLIGVPARVVAVNAAEMTATVAFCDKLVELPVDSGTIARFKVTNDEPITEAQAGQVFMQQVIGRLVQ